MKQFERGLLVFLLLVSAVLSISLMTRGHLWGDDFASYIMQAQSLLDGSPRAFIEHNSFTIRNSSTPPGPIAYPWGFPMLLAPLLAVFGLKLLALKLLNTVFFLAFLGVFHALARRRLSPGWSLALVAVLAFNPAMLQAHDQILSDIPFLFFSTLSILLIEFGREKTTAATAALTGLVIFFASMLRTAGLLLFVPLLAAQFPRLREGPQAHWGWRPLAIPYIVFGVLFALQSLLLPGGQESYLAHLTGLTIPGMVKNLWYYLRLPADLVRDIPFGRVFLGVAGVAVIYDLTANLRKNLISLSYIGGSLALFIVWPEDQGLRFLYPLIPLLMLLAAEGLQPTLERLPGRAAGILRWTSYGLAAVMIILSLAVSVRMAWINLSDGRVINGPFDPVSGDMFEYVREQTPPDSVIIFFKPRAMRLLSGRDAFMTQNCGDLSKGNYVVIHEKQGNNAQIGDLGICTGIDLSIVFNNQRFTVYKVALP